MNLRLTVPVAFLSLLIAVEARAFDSDPGHCLYFPPSWVSTYPSPSTSLCPDHDFTLIGWFKAPMQTNGYDGILSPLFVCDNKRHHFALSRDDNLMRLHVDGEYAGNIAASWTLGQDDPWSFGREWDPDGSSQWYEGCLDEVSLWSREAVPGP